MENKKVLQIKEAIKILGISRNTLMALISSGQLKAVKAGPRRWLIPSWAVDEFLTGQAAPVAGGIRRIN